ncbi:MAG TPA: hypothetical protein DDX92_12265 [Flavobacteriales bacterium]|nr:hypothetical protein [Flavobacteriales bacterium]
MRPRVQYWFTSKWSVLASVGLLGYESRTDTDSSNNETKTETYGFNADLNATQISFFFHF